MASLAPPASRPEMARRHSSDNTFVSNLALTPRRREPRPFRSSPLAGPAVSSDGSVTSPKDSLLHPGTHISTIASSPDLRTVASTSRMQGAGMSEFGQLGGSSAGGNRRRPVTLFGANAGGSTRLALAALAQEEMNQIREDASSSLSHAHSSSSSDSFSHSHSHSNSHSSGSHFSSSTAPTSITNVSSDEDHASCSGSSGQPSSKMLSRLSKRLSFSRASTPVPSIPQIIEPTPPVPPLPGVRPRLASSSSTPTPRPKSMLSTTSTTAAGHRRSYLSPTHTTVSPEENWLAATSAPRFSRLGLGGEGVIMPVSAKAYAKNVSSRASSIKSVKSTHSAKLPDPARVHTGSTSSSKSIVEAERNAALKSLMGSRSAGPSRTDLTLPAPSRPDSRISVNSTDSSYSFSAFAPSAASNGLDSPAASMGGLSRTTSNLSGASEMGVVAANGNVGGILQITGVGAGASDGWRGVGDLECAVEGKGKGKEREREEREYTVSTASASASTIASASTVATTVSEQTEGSGEGTIGLHGRAGTLKRKQEEKGGSEVVTVQVIATSVGEEKGMKRNGTVKKMWKKVVQSFGGGGIGKKKGMESPPVPVVA